MSSNLYGEILKVKGHLHGVRNNFEIWRVVESPPSVGTIYYVATARQFIGYFITIVEKIYNVITIIFYRFMKRWDLLQIRLDFRWLFYCGII